MRLIDADALIDALMTYTWRDEDDRLIDDAAEKRAYIEQWLPNLPTVELLKEQEAVKPEWSNGTPFCGNCGHRLEKKNRSTEGIKCPTCGQKVKWND